MIMKSSKIALVLVIVCATARVTIAAKNYYGTHIDRLTEYHHAVSGDVYAVDSRTLFIKGFTYDGEGPAAYFYVGNTKAPNNQGAFRIRDERGSGGVLKRYRGKDITLTLPEGKTLRDIKWFSVWCDEFSVNFGHVNISKNLDFPRPQKVGGLRGIHAVQSDSIVIVDAQTLLIPNFSYDGAAPDAKFWVGRGQKPSPNGMKIADENGKETPLRRYDRKTIVLTLPSDLTVFDIGHFGVWCEAFAVDFGHVRIAENLKVPPSLKMLGISPQSKLNCEVLHDELAFEVRWAVAGESVVIQLVAKLDDNEYMSFGVSGETAKSEMVGGDVVVAWVNRLTGKGYAQDYYLESKSQCSGNHGSCPDTRLKDNTNSIRLLNAAIVNDYSIVTYQRPLKAADAYDQTIFVNGTQAILWAIGPLNQRFEVSYHTQFLKKTKLIDFGRQPFWNCPIPEHDGKPTALTDTANSASQPQTQKLNQNRIDVQKRPQRPPQQQSRPPPQHQQQQQQTHQTQSKQTTTQRPMPTPKPHPKKDAWEIPPIQCHEPEDGVFYAQMGPTGGKRGYPAITGHVGWGISWYINGLLIPEINIVRGRTYTFVVEGGNEPDNAAKYHPFYITDDPVGGYEYKSDADREKIQVFAGVHRSRSGKVTPTGIGRLCNWTPDIKGPEVDEFPSFGAYQRSLTLQCDEGEPGIITWTPDENTPDTVYYQCFSHRYLGWKINVLDSCDSDTQASERKEIVVEPEEEDSDAEPSINHETKLLPSENFLQQHEKDLIKNHNMNGKPPKVTTEMQKTGEFNRLITQGIKAAEALEEHLIREQKMNMTSGGALNSKPTSAEDDKDLMAAIDRIPSAKPPTKLIRKPVLPTSSVPLFMRPPTGPSGFPLYAPARIPQRRPIQFERRPVNRRPSSPILVPQQSMIVSHYRKPSYGHHYHHHAPPPPPPQPIVMRNYNKKIPQLMHSSKPKSPVLVLGQQTEIKPTYRKSPADVVVGRPSKGQIDVPVGKLKKIQETSRPLKLKKKEKMPITEQPKNPFKDPFNVKPESADLDVAKNTGFKEDTVIVESGFRPIFRREDIVKGEDDIEDNHRGEKSQEPTISRRSDDFGESNEEDDHVGLLTYEQPQSHFFEPMFIPSPRDSIALALVNDSSSAEIVETPEVGDMQAEASEKEEFYYLPPSSDSKRTSLSLDSSLLENHPLPQNDFYKLSSKTKQFIKETPQFTQYKGELPKELQQQISGNHEGVKEHHPAIISTKLSAVSTNNATRRKRDELDDSEEVDLEE